MFKFRPAVSARLAAVAVALALSTFLQAVCSTSGSDASFSRPFVFGADNFSYPNDLMWVYYKDPETGKFRHKDREPPPDYSHHCFAVARSARQFFQNARFDPKLPISDEAK